MRKAIEIFLFIAFCYLLVTFSTGCSDGNLQGQENTGNTDGNIAYTDPVFIGGIKGDKESPDIYVSGKMLNYTEEWEENFGTRTYYDEEGNKVAETFSLTTIIDYIYDYDNDGENELVSCCMYGGDMHKEVYIFKIQDGVPYKGSVKWKEEELPGLDYWGANAVQTGFSPETKEFFLGYYGEPLDGKKNIIHINCRDMIEFDPFTE